MVKKTTNKEFALHLSKHKKMYFEGWYFKIQTSAYTIAIIIGIHLRNGKKEAFIQTLDTIRNYSTYRTYQEKDIKITDEPFQLQLQNNEISMDHLHIQLDSIVLDVDFHSLTPIHTSLYMPSIMGPFSYLPMECVHSIISLHHQVHGSLRIDAQEYPCDGIGYIEKDRGRSFPKEYVWFQSNHCSTLSSCFFLSIATIPLSIIRFQGCICELMVKNTRYRFATYLGCQIQVFDYVVKHGIRHIYIKLHQFYHTLFIHIIQGDVVLLKGPKDGDMKIRIEESVTSRAYIQLYYKKQLLLKEVFVDGGCEIHEYPFRIE